MDARMGQIGEANARVLVPPRLDGFQSDPTQPSFSPAID
jgi:hypothetical protein